MSRQAVLILSADVLAAALLGAVVELAGHDPHFPRLGETPREALRRIHPRLALIDCDHEEACQDAFLGPTLMTGARVLLIASDHRPSDGAALAGRLGLTVLRMPAEHERLTRFLSELPVA